MVLNEKVTATAALAAFAFCSALDWYYFPADGRIGKRLAQANARDAPPSRIVKFDPRYRSDFAADQFTRGLKSIFTVEPLDRRILTAPKKRSSLTAGNYFALHGTKVVGTVHSKVETERNGNTKMVSMSSIACRLWRLLVNAAMDYARAAGVKRLVLSSHTSLTPALPVSQCGVCHRENTAVAAFALQYLYARGFVVWLPSMHHFAPLRGAAANEH